MSFFQQRFRSFLYAFKGIGYLIRTQPNAWIHLLAVVIVVTTGLYCRISTGEWCLVVFASGFVIAAEIFNTAIEKFVDLVSPEKQEKAGIVKDLAAGGVLVAAITALIIGMLIFLPKFLLIFF